MNSFVKRLFGRLNDRDQNKVHFAVKGVSEQNSSLWKCFLSMTRSKYFQLHSNVFQEFLKQNIVHFYTLIAH